MDFARRRKPGHCPREKEAGLKKGDRLADSCARRSQQRRRRGNHPGRVCMIPSTRVMLCSQGCHTSVPRCKLPGDLGSVSPEGSPESPPSSSRATQLTSCRSASTPRAERTKPRSGRSADTEAPTPCAGLLVLVLTFDGNSAIAIESLRRPGRAPGAAPAAAAAWDPWT